MILIFSGMAVIATSILLAGSRPGARPAAQRARPVATMIVVTSAVGLLFSCVTLYLTYRPSVYGDYFRLLAGPHFAYNANSRVTSVRARSGGTNARTATPSSCYLTSDEVGGNAFTTAVGGGLDVRVFRFFWVRPDPG
jgi:hypothetical protein